MQRYKPGSGPLLQRVDLEELADTIAAVNATADLLGRAHVRQNVERLEQSASPIRTFADDPFPRFRDPVPVIRTPREALDYFINLIPTIGVDPERWEGEQRRRAFTLAQSTNDVLTRRVQDAVAAGIAQNKSYATVTTEIENRLKEYGAMGRNPQYAEMVMRTNAADSYQTAVYEEGRDDDVKDYFPAWQYVGIRDNRTGDDHLPKIDKYYPAHATFADVRGPRPYNCILPGNHVHGRARGASKAYYSGEAVEINTAGGSRLSVTANHPVLTNIGFIPAHAVTESDRVICYDGRNQVGVVAVDKKNSPSEIEEVFQSLSILGWRSRKSPLSALDFYGDGRSGKGQVEIIRPDVKLLDNIVSIVANRGSQSNFPRRNVLLQKKPCRGPLAFNLKRILHTATGGMGVADLIGDLIGRHAGPLQSLRIGSAAELDIPRGESAGQNRTTDLQLVGKLLQRYPGKVSTDRVVNVKRFGFSGHVYDLETECGYFVAGQSIIPRGIIVSNCRCSLRWLDYLEWNDLVNRGAKLETKWGK